MKLSNVPAGSWLWLFPATYLIHILEEYYGGEGYTAHLLRTRGIYMSPTRFLVSQMIGTALVLFGVVIARRRNFANAFVIIMGAIVLVNALIHMVNSLRTLEYEPGLLSSIVIWLPLGVLTLIKYRRKVASHRVYWSGIAIGVFVNLIIAVFSSRGGRLF